MTPLTPSDVLRAAADLIEPEGAWTQNAFARGRSGREVEAASRSAVCFCAIGAIARVSGLRGSTGIYATPTIAVEGRLGTRSLGGWNDDAERTQAEVVSKLREVAAQLEAAQ